MKIDPFGRPTVPSGSDHYIFTRDIRPSVHFLKIRKTKQTSVERNNDRYWWDRTVDLAEGIIDDTRFLCNLLWKFSLHSAHIFFEHLTISDLLFHISGFLGISSEHEKPGCEPVQAMDGPKVFQVVFLGQDENHCVVTVATTRMDLD